MADTTRSSRISPTAHVTGYVWARHGLAPPGLATGRGRAIYLALKPMAALVRRLRLAPDLDTVLLQRHLCIDHLLRAAVERGEVGQVVEIAAGLSPRGLRWTREHPGLTYVEADLPGMVETKKRLLSKVGSLPPRLHHVAVDALADAGPHSLEHATAGLLDPRVGTAVITEGLLSYLEPEAMRALWSRIARFLGPSGPRGGSGGFPQGRYLGNLHIGGETGAMVAARLFRRMVALFSRGPVYLHFGDADEAQAALIHAGFSETRVLETNRLAATVGAPPWDGPNAVSVFEARVAAEPI